MLKTLVRSQAVACWAGRTAVLSAPRNPAARSLINPTNLFKYQFSVSCNIPPRTLLNTTPAIARRTFTMSASKEYRLLCLENPLLGKENSILFREDIVCTLFRNCGGGHDGLLALAYTPHPFRD